MLSRLKTTVSAYNNSSDLHNQSVDYLVKAINVYPYDDGINGYVNITRNFNANFNTLSPVDLMARITSNDLTAKCLQDTGSYCDRKAREILAWNLYKVRNGLYDKNDGNRLDDLKLLVKNLKESTPAAEAPARDTTIKPARDRKAKHDREPAKPKATVESERAGLLRLAERYVALSEELGLCAGEAAKRWRRAGRVKPAIRLANPWTAWSPKRTKRIKQGKICWASVVPTGRRRVRVAAETRKTRPAWRASSPR